MFTDPVVGKDFFGRQEVLQLLLKRASALSKGFRQNVAVLGPALIGKSSLLQEFMIRFDDPKTAVVYIAFRGEETFEEFTHRFTTIFIHAFVKRIGKSDMGSVSFQRDAFESIAPQTAVWLKAIAEKRNRTSPTETFGKLLELPLRTWKETGKFTLLILDEFDRLLDFEIEEPFAHFGKQIMVQKETMFLLASSQITLARMILRQRLSLLFGHFEILDLAPFSPKSAKEYLEKRWCLEFLDPGVKQFLIFLTGGHPFYLNVLGQHLSTLSLPGADASPRDVLSVLEKVLFNAQGILNHYFTMTMDRIHTSDRSGKSIVILRALAQRPHTSFAIRALFKNSKELHGKLLRLQESGLISKTGIFYRLHDRLFAFWLRSCFEKKSNILIRNISEQSSEFRKEAEEAIRHFKESLKESLSEKILGLFNAFKGEIVEIDQKRHRLPTFSEVRLANGRKGSLMVVAQKEKGYWVSNFFQHVVTEADVSDFLNQCHRLNHPISQRILAPLGGMDENARLLAKKEKLWTWELESLNALFDLFGRGPIHPRVGEKDG